MFTVVLTVHNVKRYRKYVGAVERRTRQREELRSQILDAARDIVLNDGYKALTMRRIAEAVEYSPAAIYQYFENRDAIAVALMEEGFVELADAFEPLATIEDPRERIEAVGRAYVAHGLEHSATYRLMFMEDPQITAMLLDRPPTPHNAGARAYMALVNPLLELHAQGRLREGLEVQALADTLWTALHGIVSLKLTCPRFPETPTDTLLDTSIAVLLNGATTG